MWANLHHPDFNGKVLRRRITAEIIDFACWWGQLTMSRGRSYFRNDQDRPDRNFYHAVRRLKKDGLLIEHRKGRVPHLSLAERTDAGRPAYHHPQRYWNRKWNGIWYVLIYDVPENDRSYRDTLRRFLRRLRLGRLQQSVWISPDDFRPHFADLKRGASVGSFAHLMESRTVLGQSSEELVQRAWNFNKLFDAQHAYCVSARDNLERLSERTHNEDDLLQLARKDMTAYAWSMEEDPLLPSVLCPPNYMGEKAWQLHETLRREIRARLG
jgi:phenylacetic acid degradation operon negative regulatory protein